mmetsp:Transcript_126541/g.188849  ORF Transcript_126541/g.188849 Transcript_126541/m.188849 type:complete len:241 (+) Transcript_126541:2-724(+)
MGAISLMALAAVAAAVVVVMAASGQNPVDLAQQMVPAQAGQQQLVYMAQPGQFPGVKPGQMIAVQNGHVLFAAQPGSTVAAQLQASPQAKPQILAARKPVQASPSQLPVAIARPIAQPQAARAPVHKPVQHPVHHPAQVHHLQKAPYPAETEAQAIARSKVWARKAYLATYNEAMNAENAAEVQERKNRAARAQHFKQRAAMFDALKKKADRKEGYVKLEREMGMIMDGVDGLHYRGYKH